MNTGGSYISEIKYHYPRELHYSLHLLLLVCIISYLCSHCGHGCSKKGALNPCVHMISQTLHPHGTNMHKFRSQSPRKKLDVAREVNHMIHRFTHFRGYRWFCPSSTSLQWHVRKKCSSSRNNINHNNSNTKIPRWRTCFILKRLSGS